MLNVKDSDSIAVGIAEVVLRIDGENRSKRKSVPKINACFPNQPSLHRYLAILLFETILVYPFLGELLED